MNEIDISIMSLVLHKKYDEQLSKAGRLNAAQGTAPM